MAPNRWKSLDYEPPRVRRGDGKTGGQGDSTARPEGLTAPERPSPAEAWRGHLTGVVAQARGAYLLRNFQAAVDLLEVRLAAEPALPGGQRILGQSLARLSRRPEAVERLRAAARLDPEDWLARASLGSLLLRHGSLPLQTPVEAITHLRDAFQTQPLPALRELLGAAHWVCGQAALVEARFREAIRSFGAAGVEFGAAAAESRAARAALAARRATSLVGEAVALLSAGEIETAQRLFSRSAAPGLSSGHPLARFAACLYEFCDELARLPAPERPEAAAALREAVLAVRLEVGFYDGRQAVSLAWLGGPS